MLNYLLMELFAKVKNCPMCGKLLKELPSTIPPLKMCPDYHGVLWVTDDGPPMAAAIFTELDEHDTMSYRQLFGSV